jgi:hypothetical protein
MQGPAHGAMVAGASSALIAGRIRQRTVSRFDSNIEPPTLQERVHQRLPWIAAGLGFTGLSTAVAMSFDKIELSILSDINDPRLTHQQLEHHRELHSLPYLGGAIGAAHLIRHSSSNFGQWIAANLNYPERAEDIVKSLNDLADWVIDSTGFGVLGHIVGDIPTKGHGGTALKLLKPITNHNFSLGWIAHNEPHVQKVLFVTGMALTGAAWTITGAYALSWEPPEKKITSYLQTLNEYDSFSHIIQHILNDLKNTFNNIFGLDEKSIWSLPIFENSLGDIRNKPKQNWFQIDVDPNQFGVPSFDKQSLVEEKVLPPEFTSPLTSKPLYEQKNRWPSSNGIPLVVNEESGIPIQIDDKDGRSLETGSKDGTPIQTDNQDGIPLQSDNKDGMSF